MKHYIHLSTNEVFAFELDGSQDHLISDDLTPLDDAELAAIRATAVQTIPLPNISRRQLRQALTRMNLRIPVEAAVYTGTQDLQDWWECADQCERNHEEVVGMLSVLNVSPEVADSVWILGASL